jgi:nicotinate-nucleotide pyrophosphorylase (carboxylating)
MEFQALIDQALAEDVGTGDATTEATVEPGTKGSAKIVQKAPGVIFGLELVEETFRRLDPKMSINRSVAEGQWHPSGTEILRLNGDAAALLTGERTALNYLAHLSGIATLTAEMLKLVREVSQTVKLLDTRKTTPGLRKLEKAAVAAGGGTNHRAGLYDAVLIKENHIAIAGGITRAVELAKQRHPELAMTVEVRNEAEIAEALTAGAPRLLLDNMSPPEVRSAIELIAGRAEIEISGGITRETLKSYAEIDGVDYISIGALTHSAKALDLSFIVLS